MAPYPVHVTPAQAHPLIARLSEVLPGARVLTDPSETQDLIRDPVQLPRVDQMRTPTGPCSFIRCFVVTVCQPPELNSIRPSA